jgi:hypothetical protein
MQRIEMEKRDRMLAEQTAIVLESSESIKLFEKVLTKKQRAQLLKQRQQKDDEEGIEKDEADKKNINDSDEEGNRREDERIVATSDELTTADAANQ